MNESSLLNQTNKTYKQNQEAGRQTELSNYLTPHNNNQPLLIDMNHNFSSSQQLFRGRMSSRYYQNNNQLSNSSQIRLFTNQQYQLNLVNQLNANRISVNLKNRYQQKEKLEPSQKIYQALKIKLFTQKVMSKLNRFVQKDLLDLTNDETISSQSQNNINKMGQIEIKNQIYQNLHLFLDFYKNFTKILDSSTWVQKLVGIVNTIPVISPSGKFKFIWDIIMMIVILLYLFMIPIEITFYQPLKELFPFNLLRLCNMALIIDFTLQWNFGFFDKGQPNMNRMQVMIKYFRSQFYVDLASSLFLLIDFYWQNNNANYVHLLFFLRLENIKKFFKRVEERFNLSPLIIQISSLIQLLLLILIVAHTISCVWIEVLQYETKHNFQNTWIGNNHFKEDNWASKYIHAYYFSTVTMITVGYGDFTPSNNTEMVISLITMLFSCGVFAYSINAVGTIFNTLNQKSLDIKNNMYTISSYMAKKNIDFELQMQIKEYLEYFWNMQYSRDQQQEQNLISQLSPKLKERLLLETFKMIVVDCQIFKDNFSQQFIMDIIQLIQECSYRPDEIILSESIQDDHSLYFIESGQVQVFVDEDAKKVLKNLKKGDFFGDFSFFTGQSTNLNYKATEFTQIFKIKRSIIFGLFQNKPSDLEAFCNIKDNLLFTQNYSIIHSRCYYCLEPHLTTNCTKLFPQFNKVRIANISNKSDLQIRQHLNSERKLSKYAEILFLDYSQNILQQFISDYQQDIDYYDQKYIWKEGDEDIEEELSGNQEEEYHNQSSFNIKSQQDLPSLEFEKQKSRKFSHNSSQISFKRNKHSSSNFEEDSQQQKSPIAKLKSKPNVLDEVSDLNHLNFKKINSKDQQIMESPINKRRLIKIQQIQTSLKGVNNFTQRLSQVNEYQQLEPLAPQIKYNDSPIRVPSQRHQISKNSQIYDVKTLKEQIQTQNKILVEQNKNSELILKLQHIFEQQNNLKEKNEQNEENNLFDVQKNFEIYLPHNNLSQIIEYLKFKSRFLKQLKFQYKNMNLNKMNSQQIINFDNLNNKESYINQYPFNVPSCQRNFQIMRVFERKVKQQNLKKNQKNNRCSIIQQAIKFNQNVKSSIPNTKLQKVLEQFQYISQNQDETNSLDQQMLNTKQINYINNQINSISIHNIKNDGDHQVGIRQSNFSQDHKQLISSQKKNQFQQSETQSIQTNQNKKEEISQESHFKRSYIERKQLSSSGQKSQNNLLKRQTNSDSTIFQIVLSEKNQVQSEDQNEIESPSQYKKQIIHSTQKFAQKKQYFQSDDGDSSNQINLNYQNNFQDYQCPPIPITQYNNQRLTPFKKKLSILQIEKQHF
ncbi:hypothetical protein ABPG72_007999 [Tetrahymena utriculariae]